MKPLPRLALIMLLSLAYSFLYAAPPANDNCVNAVSLTPGSASCSTPVSGTTVDATQSTQSAFISAYADDDVWYKFTTSASGTAGNVNVTVSLSNITFVTGSPADFIIERRDGASFLCDNYFPANGTITSSGGIWAMSGLSPSTEYSIRVYTNADLASGTRATFDICVFVPTPPPIPANDNCDAAQTLTPSLGTCTGTGPYTTLGATASTQTSGDGSGKDDDVWFSFTTGASSAYSYSATLSNRVYTPFSGQSVIELWASDCGTGTGTFINWYSFTTTASFGVLSPNTTYKIRVYTYSTSTRLTSFDICVSYNIPPPANDTYLNAKTISLVSSSTVCTTSFTGETTLSATGENPPACSGASTSPPNDVWYKFVATKTTAYFEIKNIAQVAGSSTLMWMQVLQSSNTGPLKFCSNTNSMNFDGSDAAHTLTIGTTYYLRVYNDVSTSACTFDLCNRIPPGPTYTNCVNAVSITPSADEFCAGAVRLTNVGADQGTVPASCAGTTYNNIWIKFVAPVNSNSYLLTYNNYTAVSGSSTLFVYSTIYSGVCGSLTEIGCVFNDNTLPILAAGQTYYIKIGTNNITNQGSFDICLKKTPNNATNITCATATGLTATTDLTGAFTTGTTQGATPITTPDCYGFSSNNKFVYYSFIATATSHYVEFTDIVKLSSNQSALGFKIQSGTCAGLTDVAGTCIASAAYDNHQITGLSVGQTYYIVVMENTYNGGAVSFKLRVTGGGISPNNEAVTATQLIQNPTCSTTASTLRFSTLSSTPAITTVPTTPTQDVWFKFTAVTTSVNITVAPSFGILRRVIYANDLTTVLSDTYSSGLVSGFTPGQNYYIRIANDELPNEANTSNFTICVSGLPSVIVADAPTAASCATVNGPVTSTNSNTWLHITHQGKLIASVFDAPGNSGMGIINAGYYLNTASVRADAGGAEYLDRNYSITPTIQPAIPVRLRLYFSRTEFETLVNANDGDGNDVYYLNDLKVNKFSSEPCGTNISNSGGALYNVLDYGLVSSNVYYVEISIPSFSSFFLQNNLAALPVGCSNFTYKLVNNAVQLQWSTLAESNSSHFEIEKSIDGTNFIKLAAVNAAGNSTTVKNYLYSDVTRNNGAAYYRIKQVDKNGASAYVCRTIKLNVQSVQGLFSNIYPNPVKNNLVIDIVKQYSGKATIEIINSLGQPLTQQQRSLSNADNQLIINTTALISGTYLIKITTTGGVFTQRLVKQ